MIKHKETKTSSITKRFRRLLTAGTVLTLAILTAGLVVGLTRQRASATNTGSLEKKESASNNHRTYVTRSVGGQTVQIDTQTGQIKPLTQAEAQKLADALKGLAKPSVEGLQPIHHADGSVSIDLQDRFQNVALARKEADGTVSQTCVDNPQSGAAFFGIDPKLVGAETNTGVRSAAPSRPAKQ
jgi:hypothetical protein